MHGTGVRQPAFGLAFDRFRDRLAAVRPDYGAAECYWGGTHGSRLNAKGISIPVAESHRGLSDPSLEGMGDEDAEVALWGLLERDPLFELRLLPADGVAAAELPPNGAPPGLELAAAARRLTTEATVAYQADAAGLGGVLIDAVESVLSDAAATDALRQEMVLGGVLRAALARAITAEALRRADEQLDGALPLDGGHRDALVAAMVGALGGSDRGLGGALLRSGLSLALHLGATKPLERRRAAISEAAAPAAGDVLMYLARGARVREFIAEAVTVLDGPVVVVAHSLGGVASVELLGCRALPAVKLLVTVGSQAPLLYELDALPTLPFGYILPDSVPRWVNVFDRRDLLAYVGAGVFPGRVEDREIDNRAPFPRAHSAYFANERLYTLLEEVLP
ncbi:hypothetical protein ABT010_33685 [Streptomyces sp. NPDC002668]|uniref:hypothetical protein n=1 Tax=Streptomyces sp. NPDC002668 TaxID=3154422 RepID=UPI00331D39F5